MYESDAKAAEETRIRKLADEIAHDVVEAPADGDDPDLAAVSWAFAGALACLKDGGTVDDARAAAGEALKDLDAKRAAARGAP